MPPSKPTSVTSWPSWAYATECRLSASPTTSASSGRNHATKRTAAALRVTSWRLLMEDESELRRVCDQHLCGQCGLPRRAPVTVAVGDLQLGRCRLQPLALYGVA